MKKEIVELVIALVALFVGGAAEELVPKAYGVGFPVLLSATAYMSVRRTPLSGIVFAVAAGAAEDALSGLPPMTSIAWFVAVASLMRGFKLPLPAAAFAFCGYQLWLWAWLGGELQGHLAARLLAALFAGALALAATSAVLWWLDRKGAVDEK